MRQGFSGYTEDIADALKNMSVTDSDGNVLGHDEGVDAFIQNAHRIKNAGGIFMFCGNGASATMAEHMSHDFFQNGDFMTMTCSETAHITAIANDVSYEDVFAYRIGKALSAKDALITISSSGNSPNVVKAQQTAKEKGMFIVTLSGMKADNKSRSLGCLNFYVPADTYGMVESAHAMLLHYLFDAYLDKYMGGRH